MGGNWNDADTADVGLEGVPDLQIVRSGAVWGWGAVARGGSK